MPRSAMRATVDRQSGSRRGAPRREPAASCQSPRRYSRSSRGAVDLQRARNPRVFSRDGVPVRVWRTALRDACRKAKVPHRLLHDCRRTAARNLIRAGVPERIAMLLTGHKTRAVFDRYNIVNEQELLTAGERLAAYVGTSGASTGATSATGLTTLSEGGRTRVGPEA